MRNPTQAAFVSWSFEEENHRIERRQVHLNQTAPDEFIQNPTQTVFVPWGFVDEGQAQQRRVGLRRLPALDIEGLPFTAAAATAWTEGDERSGPRSRPYRAPQQSDIDGLPFTAAAAEAWADIDQYGRIWRHSWWAR